jgi:hypothetical protein
VSSGRSAPSAMLDLPDGIQACPFDLDVVVDDLAELLEK